jgi:Carboxypeptidase regulatory-like domain
MRCGAKTALGIVCLMTLSFATAFSAPRQDQKGDLELRTIHGSVIDKNENPISSSVVYLLNVKTESVKTYITDSSGGYRFSGLDPNVDYEVHAERGDLTSSTRTVSSFDSRRDIEVTLKLSRVKKSAH